MLTSTTAYFAPILLANKADKIFTSSSLDTATKVSEELTLASLSISASNTSPQMTLVFDNFAAIFLA